MAFIHQDDEYGRYIAAALVKKAKIDATFCRIPYFHDVGNKILYGGNTFLFRMSSSQQRWCSPTMLRDKDHTEYHPFAAKPFDRRGDWLMTVEAETCAALFTEWEDEMASAIERLQDPRTMLVKGCAVPDLQGWMYYDTFLHFLWTIGPKNASHIKSICFSGRKQRHTVHTRAKCGGRCTDDIVDCLKLYVPIIVELLPNLEHLKILAIDEDEKFFNYQDLPDGPTLEDTLSYLIEGRLQELPKLRRLEVRGFEGWDRAMQQDCLDETEKYSWADEACEWFGNRGIEQDVECHKREAANIRSQMTAYMQKLNLDSDIETQDPAPRVKFALQSCCRL
jgi:hypothetical protein